MVLLINNDEKKIASCKKTHTPDSKVEWKILPFLGQKWPKSPHIPTELTWGSTVSTPALEQLEVPGKNLLAI